MTRRNCGSNAPRHRSGEFPMHRVLILGAGKIGALISGLLAESGDYEVQLADVNGDAARRRRRRAHGLPNLRGSRVDAARPGRARRSISRDHPLRCRHLAACPTTATSRWREGRARGRPALLRPDRGRRGHARRARDRRGRDARPSCPSAGSRPASSASRPTSSSRTSTSCAASSCASAPCPSTRTTCSSIR